MIKEYSKTIINILEELETENVEILTKNEVFEIIMNYNGYINCSSEIKYLVQGVYGYNLF